MNTKPILTALALASLSLFACSSRSNLNSGAASSAEHGGRDGGHH